MNDPLGAFLLSEKDRQHLVEKFRAGVPCHVQSLPLSAQAWLILCIRKLLAAPVVWVTDSPRTLGMLHQDLMALAPQQETQISFFPARETSAARGGTPHPDLIGDRLLTLQQCMRPEGPAIIVTCIQALFQNTPAPHSLASRIEPIRVAQEIELDEFLERLVSDGYTLEAEVNEKKQASHRGGILDIWPPTEPWPIRMEFFGPVVESIRTFDPIEQRSLSRMTSAVISPAVELRGEPPAANGSLLDFLPPETRWGWSEPESIHHHAEMYRSMLAADDPSRESARLDPLHLRIDKVFGRGQLVVGLAAMQPGPTHEMDFRAADGLPSLEGRIPQPDVLDAARQKLVNDLVEQARQGRSIHIFFNTAGSRDRFAETCSAPQLLNFHVAPLSEGFVSEATGLFIVAESDLYGFRKIQPGRYELHGKRPGPDRTAGARLVDWTDIQPGELVVHVDHGIGKYLGLYQIEFDGQIQEVLAIEYADKAKLYVPVSQTHLLSRYVGVGHHRPPLHTLGGRRWNKEKVAAERAVQDLAASLLETQARRDALDGLAFPADTPWQHEFEAAFPYQETADQSRAITEVKSDMESRRPMDRLVCGDVGYGKTEVAMRAAFKAVMSGKQVGVLVPTTILAQQHYDTFSERMAAYPVAIEMLSRFRTRAQQADVVRRLAAGEVDIVIGTHRMLQSDVKFHDLGLVVIDEEQRFGVAHKEHLKHMRELVDVLTLTATPIPRTLYMSLTGAKDMSTIQTPPQDRLPVETIVVQYSEEVVRQAILHELNRGGQVFYLYNRVMSIHGIRQRLCELVPEARVAVAHGQMNEKELAEIMHAFVRAEFDVLLCTTIIESGVDIPNVNTILIDRADRFGMADLYQLRGRVGRYKNKAYAYLLLPRHGHLFDDARKRIGAIKRYSSLGAGFKLALRDLEIRGAGNMLGAEQSGHIAAVGFDLYCQLLKRTVARLKDEPLPPIVDVKLRLDFIDLSPAPESADRAAAIPSSYIEDENLRVSAYRKIAAASLASDVDSLYGEMKDRFGPIPSPLDRLLKIARLRIIAAAKTLQSVEVREDKVMMMRNNDYLMINGRFPRLREKETTRRLEELLGIIADWKN